MLRHLGTPVILLALVCSALTVSWTGPAVADAPPVHQLSVSGSGLGMYPDFDPTVDRYALTTTADTGGDVTVTASTSDPAGVVLVDGRPVVGGQAEVTGLSEGDEISVVFHDSSGPDEVHSLVYLPVGFPKLTEVVPAAAGTAPGDVLLTLTASGGVGNFETAVDHRGVPAYVRSFAPSQGIADLKPLGTTGHYTVARGPTPVGGRTGSQIVELDSAFHEVRRYETVGIQDTDNHDSIVNADGSRILIGNVTNPDTHLLDPVIEEADTQGHVVYRWDLGDHITPSAETTNAPGVADYAHVNAIQYVGGDLLVSFRHLSSVYLIDWNDDPTDGHARGDIIWRLGGRHSSFTFPGDPYGGPCAQHAARLLDATHVLLWDNGSAPVGNDTAHCVDQGDPSGPPVSRPQSRAVEYTLDTAAHTATVSWSWQKDGWWSLFAGSTERLPNGNTLVDWAAKLDAIASEVDEQGNLLWELKDSAGYFSYRAFKADVPDTIDPVVGVDGPADGAHLAYGQQASLDFTCTDRGGSSLQTCSGPRGPLPTAPGRHSWTVTATDGAGNRTTVTRSYTVAAAPYSAPDVLVRFPGHSWSGAGTGGHYPEIATRLARRGQHVQATVRLLATGNRTDTYRLHGTSGSRRFSVRYLVGGRDVTRAVEAGTWQVSLRPGGYRDLVVRVTRLHGVHRGDALRTFVRGTSTTGPTHTDGVWVRVRG